MRADDNHGEPAPFLVVDPDLDLTAAWLDIVDELDSDPAAIADWIARLTPNQTDTSEKDTLTLPEHFTQ